MASSPPTQGQQTQPPYDQKPVAATHHVQQRLSQQQLVQQQLYPGKERMVPFDKNWHVTKIVFRSFDLVFSIVVLGLAIYVILDMDDGLTMALCSPPAIAAIIWEVAEFITLCARGGRVGIHPGAHVALHLLIWLVWAISLGFEATSLYFYGIWGDYDDDLGALGAVVAFGSLLFIVHFTLFVGACVETSRRNNAARPVYIMPSGPTGAVFLANQQTMPPQHAFAYQPGVYQQPGMYQPGMYQQGIYPQSTEQQNAYPPATYPPPTQQARASTHAPADLTASREKAPASASATIASDAGPSVPQRQHSASPMDGSYYGPGNEFQNQRE
ncbi:hypothetical protein ACRALDRAFT_1081731 [Sodiomyces alcalophilus JCM 7366]|uniref:uncharacterized protein n=1 Tax=Sodiomyces alcalophilus JCM 7366 TaxID=591952 RepID=UPI0039B4D1F6